MPRRDGPTTMRTLSEYAEGLSRPRSGRQMNADLQEQKAARELRALIDEDVDNGPRIRQMLKSMSAREALKKFRGQ